MQSANENGPLNRRPNHRLNHRAAASALLLCAALAAPHAVPADPEPAGSMPVKPQRSLSLFFEPNLGQFDHRVDFLFRADSYKLYLARQETLIDVPREGGGGCVVKMRFNGSQADPCAQGLEELPGKNNYFKGNDPKRWVTNVSHYACVRVEDVYPGIHVEYNVNPDRLELSFVVSPGADPAIIEMSFEGMDELSVDEQGRTVISLPGQPDFIVEPPLVYQEVDGQKLEIPAHFVPQGNRGLGLMLGPYDKSLPLHIDPAVSS